MLNVLKSSILAGICISTGCLAFLNVGGILGAILFSFGLLTVVHYKFLLYTGTVGFFSNRNELLRLPIILFGNIVGCLLMALCVHYTLPSIVEQCGVILLKRLELSYMACLFLSTMCGFVMTSAVNFGKIGKYLPLLYGVPLFIMCGFLHSIADAFYYLASPYDMIKDNLNHVLIMYLILVGGNFIGCNLYRLIKLISNGFFVTK